MKVDIYATKKRYNIIYADPPWKYNARNNANTRFGRGAFGHYNLMSYEELEELPVKKNKRRQLCFVSLDDIPISR